MANENIEDIIEKARDMIEIGRCEKAYKLLSPLIMKNHPEALFLYSTFSVSGKETDEEFERRSFDLLKISAEEGYVPAIYSLAVCYDTGDLVESDSTKAAELYKAASDAGYSKGKFYHGLNLVYGSNGMLKDEDKGMQLIREAADEGVDGAIGFLAG